MGRELCPNIEKGKKLGNYIVQFMNLWIALNFDILRGGSVTLEKCIRNRIGLKAHPDKHLARFIRIAKSKASSIDGYVMSEKISEDITSSPVTAPKADPLRRDSPVPGSPVPP